MGGYDCPLFYKDAELPRSPKVFWEMVKNTMQKQSGYDEIEFNRIWYGEETRFQMRWFRDALWGQLDW